MRDAIDKAKETRVLVQEKLLDAAALRFGNLCLIFALGFSIFGFVSYDNFAKFRPGLTLWDNVWPRLLLNMLPFLVLSFITKRKSITPLARCLSGSIGVPIVFSIACSIHAWPIMWKGGTGLYLFLHGANIFVVTISILYISPPKKILITYMAGFLIFFVVPVVAIFLRNEDFAMMRMFAGDMGIFMPVIFLVTASIAAVREKLEFSQFEIQSKVTPFLGAYLTKALYESRPDMLNDQLKQGILLSIDIRNSSEIGRLLDDKRAKEFMQKYQEALVRILSRYGAHLHKSMGDGHLISIGLFDGADRPDHSFLQMEASAIEEQRKKQYAARVLDMHHALCKSFSNLVEEFQLLAAEDIALAAGVTYGEVEISVMGDANHRQELDLTGAPVVRSTRLEQHTKLLRNDRGEWRDGITGILVVSPELIEVFKELSTNHHLVVSKGAGQVRDFPEIDHVLVIIDRLVLTTAVKIA